MRRSGTRSSRRSPNRRPVRFANERKPVSRRPTKRTSRVARPRSPIGFSRNDLLGLYLLIFVGPILLIACGAVAIFAHDVALPSFAKFVTESVSRGAAEMWKRPTVFLAFLLILSIVWCLNAGGSSSGSRTDVRRGRDIRDLNEAQKRAQEYQTRRRRAGRTR